MKRTIAPFASYLLILIFCFLSVTSFSKNTSQEEWILVPKKLLTDNQKLTLDTISDKPTPSISTAEVGDNINSSLNKIDDRSILVSETQVGALTTFIIMYKLIGLGLIRTILGFFLISVAVTVYLWYFFNKCIGRSILVEHDMHSKIKKYQFFSGDGEAGALATLFLCIVIGLCCLIMFI
jgi:hypothetical protein